jgi:hypothetical protein
MNLADQAGKLLDGAKPLHNPFRKGRRSASPCILVDHPLRFGWRPAPKAPFNLAMRTLLTAGRRAYGQVEPASHQEGRDGFAAGEALEVDDLGGIL